MAALETPVARHTLPQNPAAGFAHFVSMFDHAWAWVKSLLGLKTFCVAFTFFWKTLVSLGKKLHCFIEESWIGEFRK